MSAARGYLFDLFISYPRRGSVPRWVQRVLVPALTDYLEDLVFDPPSPGGARVFLDERQIPSGASWPAELAEAHHRSRLIVPVLCAPWFTSGWCVQEWRQAWAREEFEKEQGRGRPRVVVPLRFGDLAEAELCSLPDQGLVAQIRERKWEDLEAYNTMVRWETPQKIGLRYREALRQLCREQLAPALGAAPAWNEGWPRLPEVPVSGADRNFWGGM